MGELSRKDNSLCFRVGSRNKYIPVEQVSEIYCMSEISLNTKLLDFLAKNEIIVHFLTITAVTAVPFIPKSIWSAGNCSSRR